MLNLLSLALLTTVVGPHDDPFIQCAWSSPPVIGQNIAFTGFGYTGQERGFRIHQGNYDDVNDNLDYTIEVLWNVGDCAGTVYTLRFPNHGLTNHAELVVLDGSGSQMGRLVAAGGSLPVLYNQNDVALPTNKLGPFVITSAMVGGASGMAQTVTFTLMDAQILSRLPAPIHYNGAAPTTVAQEDIIAAAYDDLVDANEYLYTFFTFRRMLGALTSAEKTTVEEAITEHLYELGPMHGDPFWEEHHHVDHGIAVAPAVAGSSFGGFFNGHRNYLADLERDFAEGTRLIAFRRVPAWNPGTDVPVEFDIGIDDVAGGIAVETAYEAANICANYPASNSSAPTMAERLAEMELELGADVESWHNSVHVGLGGDMAFVSTAARAPIFHPWHTAVDTIWRNWQVCQAAHHPNRYSWDEL